MPRGVPRVRVVRMGVVVVLVLVVGRGRRRRRSALISVMMVVVGVVMLLRVLRVAGAAAALMVVRVVMVAVGVVVVVVVAAHGAPGVQRDGPPEAHDGLGDVVEERRELVPVDRPLAVHVVDVEDELHLLLPAAAAGHRKPADELLIVDLPRMLLVEDGEQALCARAHRPPPSPSEIVS